MLFYNRIKEDIEFLLIRLYILPDWYIEDSDCICCCRYCRLD